MKQETMGPRKGCLLGADINNYGNTEVSKAGFMLSSPWLECSDGYASLSTEYMTCCKHRDECAAKQIF